MKQIRGFEYHTLILPSLRLTQMYIEVQKHLKQSTYASEIQHSLLLDRVVHPNEVPGTSKINQLLREDLLFSRKKLTVLPFEAKKQGALDRKNEYLQGVSRYPASKLHFSDESIVIKTTGNRKYGNARVGERAIEVQHYASNATFTINLLHYRLTTLIVWQQPAMGQFRGCFRNPPLDYA